MANLAAGPEKMVFGLTNRLFCRRNEQLDCHIESSFGKKADKTDAPGTLLRKRALVVRIGGLWNFIERFCKKIAVHCNRIAVN